MKPFFVLIVVCIISNLVLLLLKGDMDILLAGKVGLAVMLLFTALGHLLYTKGMMLMLPDFVPFKKEMIYGTGLMEFMAAIGLFVPQVSRITGILLIVFFLLVLPTNIRANLKRINYETATFDGAGPNYLWFRIPFQILLIVWTYYFVVH
ncbi:membrane protein [Sphingobacterium sp. Ag1]|uniref:DoxX family protein n=1 Tax=Sphingobacterium sp. Ag1 TaxID=1643451 RepID=UPI000627DC82|nr:membrane protein [Sphingobacterium sp. Ag1]KKO89848.1 membrane protein [Sphingobacterium sp. Ag1]